ncbi:MAG: hypothetical protein RSB76_02505 [Clostridia bacterium]
MNHIEKLEFEKLKLEVKELLRTNKSLESQIRILKTNLKMKDEIVEDLYKAKKN